jgi:glutamyl-tRNA reductase
MSILLVGLNHRTAPIKVREQLAFSREGTATALLLFRNRFPNSEAAILSTCNRVEVLVATDSATPTHDDIVSFLAQARDLPVSHFRNDLYELSDEQATRHLFRVASGLDSMVLGEDQIVGQVKNAYTQASEQGTTGRLLNRLFHHAFSVSKRVRTETEIGRRKVSIPSVAVDVARNVFDEFADKRVLVIGAGDMAQLVCQYLKKADARHFTVTGRTLANARTLAEACEGRAVPFSELDEELAHADIVIAATSCPKPIITTERVRLAQKRRRGRPMFMIDLAVPRNVEAEVERFGQVYVYDVDTLGRIVAENQQQRSQAIGRCERILDEELDAFEQWLSESRARPLIGQLYSDARELGELELARLFASRTDLTPAQQQAVREFSERLVNKLMHPCTCVLREHGLSRPSAALVNALHELTEKQRQLAGRD